MVGGSGASYLGLGVTLAATGQLLLKRGVSNLAPFSNRAVFQFYAGVAGSPWVWAGVIAYVLSSLIWLVVISRMPLSIAYPALSASYAAVIILSAVFFGEPLTGWKVFSGALIVSGVLLLAYRG